MSLTTNKASGGDGIQAELFQIQKMTFWKGCTQYASKFGKLSSGHRTGKGQFSFHSQRKAMPKNVQTTAHLYSSHMLVKWCSKFSKPGFNSCEPWTSSLSSWIEKRQWNKRSNCQHPLDHWKSKRVPEKHLLLFCWVRQSLWLCGLQQTVENSERDGNARPPDLPPK